MTEDKPSGGVQIGNVTGGISGSIIAGRDVSNATITLGGQPTQASEEPTVDKLKQLLAEIQAELAEITVQKESLEQVDPSAPLTAQGAEAGLKATADKLEQEEIEKEEAESLQRSLVNATNLLSGILDAAKTVAQKADEVGQAVQPIAEKLVPLVDKVGVAALWAAKLWLL